NGSRDELQKKSGTQTLMFFDGESCCRHRKTLNIDHAERENQPATSPFRHQFEESSSKLTGRCQKA
ncbi:uncharacterized protein METZ01_LOCUS263752, partial [marine metagenome]